MKTSQFFINYYAFDHSISLNCFALIRFASAGETEPAFLSIDCFSFSFLQC